MPQLLSKDLSLFQGDVLESNDSESAVYIVLFKPFSWYFDKMEMSWDK